MNRQFTRSDLEGDLLQIGITDSANTQFVKQLSSEKLWHFTPEDIYNRLSSQLVNKIKIDLIEEKAIYLFYELGIRPLDLQQIRSYVRPEAEFRGWRISKLAVDLCVCLRDLHLNDLPQLVIHPDRIGTLNCKFTILPTLSGVMPAFRDIQNNEATNNWLYYTAPEVLRTRGKYLDLLFAADIYSIGRILELLACFPTWTPNVNDPLAFIEILVERSEIQTPEKKGIQQLSDIENLINAMCQYDSKLRPDLEYLIDAWSKIQHSYNPIGKILHLIAANDIPKAKKGIEEIEENAKNMLFELDEKEIKLLKVELELKKKEPDFGYAIRLLDSCLRGNEKDISILTKIASIYEKFTKHSEHRTYAVEYFIKAAILDQWKDSSLLIRAFDNLKKVNNPKFQISTISSLLTELTKINLRPASYSILLKAYCKMEKFELAWRTGIQYYIDYFVEDGFGQELFDALLNVAKFIDPKQLDNYRENMIGLDEPRYMIIRSAIWYSLNDAHKGELFLKMAIGDTSS